MMVSRAEYQRQYRRAHSRTPEKLNARIASIAKHRFVGIDGEGWNNEHGRHIYTMICTSTNAGVINARGLPTEQCLAFISSLPLVKQQYYVSYFFDYDVTMILQDLTISDPDIARTLFTNGNRYTWWRGYGIKYHPHKMLTVTKRGGHAVTIHDTGGLFQSSFVAALRKYGIGTDAELQHIETMKLARSTFEPDELKAIYRYSQHECKLLVQLIEHIRDAGLKAKLSPYPYEGPGGLATHALVRYYGRERHNDTMAIMPDEFETIMLATMYGGRFETLCVGNINEPVREYDLSSAYPAAMSTLPCLVHGKWAHKRGDKNSLTVSYIEFEHTDDRLGVAHPLPIRRKDGTLFYPSTGSGWYWRHEYEHPKLHMWKVHVYESWSWQPEPCDCQPFAWVRELYYQRKDMEREHKGSGIALKLMLNTLYGKMAQRRPVPGSWLNMVYASIITSKVRRTVYDAYLECGPQNTLMFATDAIFTVHNTAVKTGNDLGDFDLANEYPSLTIIQPGVYFSEREAHFKTRGVPKRIITAHANQLIAAAETGNSVTMDLTNFHGMRLTLAGRDLTKLGQWIATTRTIQTRVDTKRVGEKTVGGIVWNVAAPNTLYGASVPLSPIGNIQDMQRRQDDIMRDDETEWSED